MNDYTLLWIAGFVGVFLLSKLLTRQEAVKAGTMHYSIIARLLFPVLGVGGLAALVFALAVKDRMPAEKLVQLWPMVIFVAVLFGPPTMEFVRVKHHFDDEGLRYFTPWSRARSFRWMEVEKLRWRQSYQWFDIVDAGGNVFHFSTMLQGRGLFALTALRKIPATVLSAHPSERSVLEKMACADGGLLAS